MTQLQRLLGIGLAFLGAACGETKLYRIPLPLNVEGKYVQSSAELVLELELYNEPLTAFDAKAVDPHEKAFRDVAQAIRTNKPALLPKLIMAKPKAKPAAAEGANVDVSGRKVSPAIVERSDAPEAIAGMYRSVFNNFADLEVIGRVNLGDHYLFLWRSPKAKMNKLRGFLTYASGSTAQVEELTMERPIDTFITNSLAEVPEANLARYELKDSTLREGRFRLALGNSTAALEFLGKPYAIDAYDETAVLQEPLKTYRDAWSAFKKQNFETFLKFMAQESRTRFARFLESVKGEGVEAFYAKASGPRFIRFLLDADPVYLVFVAPTKENAWNPGALQSDMLYRNGNRFELVNAAFRTFFDDVTKNNSELEALIRDAQPAGPQAGR